MKERKTAEVISALEKKGFRLVREPNHKVYELYVNGKKSGINTWVSHGRHIISKAILNKMAKQIKIDNKEFDNLIACPFSYEDLVAVLQKKQCL